MDFKQDTANKTKTTTTTVLLLDDEEVHSSWADLVEAEEQRSDRPRHAQATAAEAAAKEEEETTTTGSLAPRPPRTPGDGHEPGPKPNATERGPDQAAEGLHNCLRDIKQELVELKQYLAPEASNSDDKDDARCQLVFADRQTWGGLKKRNLLPGARIRKVWSPRISPKSVTELKHVERRRIRTVLIMCGMEDYWSDGAWRRTIESLEKFVTTAMKWFPDANILVCSLLAHPNADLEPVGYINRSLARLCSDYPRLVFVDNSFCHHLRRNLFQSDGFTLSAPGLEVVGENVRRCLEKC